MCISGDIFENFVVCRGIFEFGMVFSCCACVFLGRPVTFLRISWFAEVFLSLTWYKNFAFNLKRCKIK